MAYMFRISKSIPGACRQSLALQAVYNHLKQYNGQEFSTIDDFYLKAGRGAVQAIRKIREIVDYRLINNCISMIPERNSEDKVVGCMAPGAPNGCMFGRLEKLVN